MRISLGLLRGYNYIHDKNYRTDTKKSIIKFSEIVHGLELRLKDPLLTCDRLKNNLPIMINNYKEMVLDLVKERDSKLHYD